MTNDQYYEDLNPAMNPDRIQQRIIPMAPTSSQINDVNPISRRQSIFQDRTEQEIRDRAEEQS